MLTHLIKSTTFFQGLLSSQFHTLKQGFVNTLVFLSTCHLFRLTNPNQVADALSIPKARLYQELNTMRLYLWQHLFVRIGCSIALEAIREVAQKVLLPCRVSVPSLVWMIPLFFAIERVSPTHPTKATSPTFGKVVVLFFADRGKVRTMLVFGKPLRACEILRIWSQHHGIEQFWQNTRVVFCIRVWYSA